MWTADDFYYVTGLDLDWDPTSATVFRQPVGSYDFAVSLVEANGTLATQLIIGDEQWETVLDIVDTGACVAYCGVFGPEAGSSYSLDFDPFDGIDIHTAHTRPGTDDSFATILSSQEGGLQYSWTVTFGGSGGDAAESIAPSEDGVWLSGHFFETADLDPGFGETWRTSNGARDLFVMKLNWRGELVWVNTVGGPLSERPYRIGLNARGDGYIIGQFGATVDFDPGPGEDYQTAMGSSNVFVTSYAIDGSYRWTRTLAPNLTPTGYGLSVRGDDQVLIDGFFEDTMDVDPGPGELLLTARGDINGLLSMWTPDGEHVWSRQIGGPGAAAVAAAEFDHEGHILATGWFMDEVDFNYGGEPDIRVSQGGLDAFLSRFTPDGEYEWTITWGGALDEDFGFDLAAHENGDISVSGYFQGTVDFDPGAGVTELTAVGNRDMFLVRFTCPQECPELLKHRAAGGVGIVKSKLVTSLPSGRATVECTGDAGTFTRAKRLDADGRGKLKLRNIPAGDYTCSVTRLEDGAGATACEGSFESRDVTVE
ncbi:MAG: hypothetical protein IT449_05575 [Phycisphaerales bacterium]|nr:hypothetical protein [Phycisphaerales bacterium]